MQNEESPAVASARPRWNESWIRVKASPWQAKTGSAKRTRAPPCTAAFVPTSAAAYMTPAARPKPAPGARQRGRGPDRDARPRRTRRGTSAATAIQEPRLLPLDPPASETERKTSPTTASPTPIHSRRGSGVPSSRWASTASSARPAGGDGLDERERRQPERDDVERPAGDPDEERDQPAPVAEEETERPPGMADRERGSLRGDRVLRDPRPVEGCRGRRGRGSARERARRGERVPSE